MDSSFDSSALFLLSCTRACADSQRSISIFLDSPLGQSLPLDTRDKLLKLGQKFVDLFRECDDLDLSLVRFVNNPSA